MKNSGNGRDTLYRQRLAYAEAMYRLRCEYSDTPAGYHDEESKQADEANIKKAEHECFIMEGGQIKAASFPRDIFIGRDRELQKIYSSFRKGHRILLISGMGGIGKTALAAAFAAGNSEKAKQQKQQIQYDSFLYDSVQYDSVQHDSAQYDSIQYDSVLWIPAGISLQQAITDDAVLTVSGMSYSAKKYRSVKEYFRGKLSAIERMAKSNKTLLILDDIKSVRVQELTAVLSLPCDILMTSRLDVKCFEQLPEQLIPCPVPLREMQEDESEMMALSLFPDISHEKLLTYRLLYRRLNGHTLALKLWLTSGGTMPETKISGMITFIDRNQQKELRHLLMNISLLPPEGVELAWAEKVCASSKEQIGQLLERSLLQLTYGDVPRVLMHPLIAENVLKIMKPDMKKCREFIKKIASDVGNAWNLPKEEMIKRLPAVRSVLYHLSETPVWMAAELDKIFTFLWVMEDYEASERGYLKLYRSITDHYGENAQETGWMAVRTAAVYHNSLRYDEAERWYTLGLEILRRCTPKNVDYFWQRIEACGKCTRGLLYRRETEKVLDLLHEAENVSLSAPMNARNDQLLLTEAYHSRRCATIYLQLGFIEKAQHYRQKMHQKMGLYFQNCGTDEPKLLDIRETDMEFEKAEGNLDAAARLLEENLAGYTLYRGDSHEDTLHCMEKLAEVLLALSDSGPENGYNSLQRSKALQRNEAIQRSKESQRSKEQQRSEELQRSKALQRSKELYHRAAAGIRRNYPYETEWLYRIERIMQKL